MARSSLTVSLIEKSSEGGVDVVCESVVLASNELMSWLWLIDERGTLLPKLGKGQSSSSLSNWSFGSKEE